MTMESPMAATDDELWAMIDELRPTYFTVYGEQLEWTSDEPMPVDWKLVCPHIDDAWINYGDRLRGQLAWYLNRVTVEHLNTGRGWEPVKALIFFVRCYPILYSREQLTRIAVGYERRRRALKRERRLSAPPIASSLRRRRKQRRR